MWFMQRKGFSMRVHVIALALVIMCLVPCGFAFAASTGEPQGAPIAAAQAKTDARTRTSIASAVVSDIGPRVYRGFALEPRCSLKLGGDTLVEGVDYRVAYKNNDRPGWATVKVKGVGRYRGSVSKRFKVRRQKVVMVGDSYATPHYSAVEGERVNRPWPELVAAAMKLDSTQYKMYRKERYGFARQGFRFKTLFRSVNVDKTVTDVLVVGGVANDRACTRTRALSGYRQFMALMKKTYPRARIMHTVTSWSFASASYRKKVTERIPWYREEAAKCGVTYLAGCEKVLRAHPDWVRADGKHPNQRGAQAIASAVTKRVRKLDKALASA